MNSVARKNTSDGEKQERYLIDGKTYATGSVQTEAAYDTKRRRQSLFFTL
jgi:hypothetical protein